MKVSRFYIFCYAIIAFPISFASIPIYIFIPDYYHISYGVNLAMMSIILFSLRSLDAIFDPFIGWYCDRYPHLSNISFVVIIVCFIGGVYITCSPIFANKLLNLFIGVFLATLAFSYTTIFIATRGALWFSDDNNKSTVISVREAFNIIGVLIASMLPFLLLIYFSQKQSYLLYAIIASTIMILASIFFLYWLNKFNLCHKQNHNFKLKSYFKSFDKNGIFLFTAYTLSAVGSAIPAITLVFFSRYILDTTSYTGLYIFLYFLGAIIFIPFIKKIALKIGFINTWGYSLIFCVIVFIFAFFLNKGDIIYFSVISFLAGGGFAAEIILPNILLAKWIDNPQRKDLGNGYYSLLAFLSKFCFAIATIIVLPLLNFQIDNQTNLVITIKIIYCILPCIAKSFAAIVLLIWSRNYNNTTN